MSLAFTGGMIGWGSSASTSIIPSEIIGDYTQSFSTATASSASTSTNNEFRVGGSKEWSNAYIYLNTTSPEYERKYAVQTISADSDLVGINITKVRWRGSRYNGANGAIEVGFSTRSAFCGSGTIQSSFGSITLSGSNAEQNYDFTHSGSGYTIPNACTVLVLKCSTNNGGFFKAPYAGANSNDFEDSSTFSSGGKGGASADAVDNDATCNVTCSQNHTRNMADLYLYYDLTEGASYSIDSSTTNKWKSNSEATPTLTVDMGSAIDLADLAIYPHSDTTVTTLGIEISTDNSTFIEMKEVETSDLTNGQWNFIGLSTGISARYVRIKSKDSSNAVLAINEVKVRSIPPDPTYEFNFTTNTGWVEADSTNTGVDTSTERLDFDIKRSTTNGKAYYDLGSSLSDTAWVIRFKCVMTGSSNGGGSNVIGSFGMSSITGSGTSTQDFLGLYKASDADDASVVINGSNLGPGTGSSLGRPSSGTTRYHEIKRTSATSWTNSIYSTSDYSGTPDATHTLTISSGITGLRYFTIANYNSGSGSGVCSGYIDDLKIYDGITSL